MKIRKVFIGLFASIFVLCGCENSKGEGLKFTSDDKTFFDITSFGVSSIEEIMVSSSIRQSAMFLYESNDYSFLETRFVKEELVENDVIGFSDTDYSVEKDAICLRIRSNVKNSELSSFESINMYISYKDHYLYYWDFSNETTKECYHSKYAIADKYIDKLLNNGHTGTQYYLTVDNQCDSNIAEWVPETGYYAENHKFVFKIEVVTDVSFIVYLNGETVQPFETGELVGDYDYYRVLMPEKDSTLAITSDHFYGKSEYKFNEIFSWVDNLNEGNVTRVKIETGPIGVDPETATSEEKFSEDERDISYNLNILKNATLEKATYDSEGGTYLKITFTLIGREYIIDTYNRYVLWNDFSSSAYFKFKDTFTDFFDIQYASIN